MHREKLIAFANKLKSQLLSASINSDVMNWSTWMHSTSDVVVANIFHSFVDLYYSDSQSDQAVFRLSILSKSTDKGD